MFEISTIKTALLQSIGLKDTEDPQFPDCKLTTTDTGMYYNDYHPLITFDNLYYIAPNYDGMSYNAYSATTSYATGSYVISDNIAYKSTKYIATGSAPDADGWKSPVNDWIEGKINATISKLCNNVATNKKINESTKTYLESIQVVDGNADVSNTITPSGRFVGFEITPKAINNITAVIDYIGLQFTAAQTNLKIYLFHSSKQQYLGYFTVSTSGAKNFEWKSASTTMSEGGRYSLPYIDYTNNIDSGGSYFIGYFEDDISGNAIYKDWEPGNNYRLFNNFITIRPIEVETLNGTDLFDLSDIGYCDNNHGINLSISVKTDITDILVTNKSLLTNALGYQFAMEMLWEMIHNPNSRINRKQENATKSAVTYEISENGRIKTEYENAIRALNFDLSSISQVLPQDGPRRIKYTAM